MKKLLLPVSIIVWVLMGCWGFGSRPPQPGLVPFQKVWGYRPVFSTDSSLLRISTEGPKTIKNPGKIYVKGNLIFQNDIGYGIHVIDKTNPSQPVRIGFIKINGNSEMSILGNNMYVNSYSDLVVLDVSNWQQVQEIKRIRNAFNQGQLDGGFRRFFIPPPEKGVYYDCSWHSGTVGQIQSGWARDSVYKMCFYQ